MLIVAVIVIGFSLFLFTSIKHNLQDASEDDFANATSRAHFIEHTLSPIRDTLIFTDLFIILTAAGMSYWLAGKTLRPVQRSLEAQQLFAAQASHELRTPLAVMRNEAEVTLRDSKASTIDLRNALSGNIEEVQKMTHLIEDLLLLARSERPESAKISPVLITELQEEVRTKLESLATDKGVLIIISPTERMTLKGNKVLLERILVNILQNSLEHTPPGGSIEIRNEVRENFACIYITDSGEGIPEKHLNHLFDRFYKVSVDSQGSGLGLAIVKELVSQQHGSISIESTEGHGTKVTLQFPLA
jgi:signal transduction histidine kinase